MSDQDTAMKIVDDYLRQLDGIEYDVYEERLCAAIQKALAAERERCLEAPAYDAEVPYHIMGGASESAWHHGFASGRKAKEEAIRALGESDD